MNPDLNKLQPYPFEKLAALKAGITPHRSGHIALSIGEPRHAAPDFIAEALTANLQGLSSYPFTRGTAELRGAIVRWVAQRFALPAASLDPERQVLPVAGTREALFAFAQAVIDRSSRPLVLMPNPFYQIYEGAALLAGAEPYYLNTTAAQGFVPEFDAVPAAIWARCQLLYICTPGNPTGAVLDIPALQKLIALADKHDFVIASDECYSEIYPDESTPPPGLLQAAHLIGNTGFTRCMVFHSLSKRSNVPGMRSGFVAGDTALVAEFARYRTYHGCAMPPHHQAASARAWDDEAHVRDNRTRYREKFAAVLGILGERLDLSAPAGGFYLWPRTPVDDQQFARELYRAQNVSVLPGTYLSRQSAGINPGANHVRMALVAPLEECVEAAHRITSFLQSL